MEFTGDLNVTKLERVSKSFQETLTRTWKPFSRVTTSSREVLLVNRIMATLADSLLLIGRTQSSMVKARPDQEILMF